MTEQWKVFQVAIIMVDTPGVKEPHVETFVNTQEIQSDPSLDGLVDQALPSFKVAVNNPTVLPVVADWGISYPLELVVFPFSWWRFRPISSFGYNVETTPSYLKIASLIRFMNDDGSETSAYNISYLWNSEHIAYSLRENLEMSH